MCIGRKGWEGPWLGSRERGFHAHCICKQLALLWRLCAVALFRFLLSRFCTHPNVFGQVCVCPSVSSESTVPSWVKNLHSPFISNKGMGRTGGGGQETVGCRFFIVWKRLEERRQDYWKPVIWAWRMPPHSRKIIPIPGISCVTSSEWRLPGSRGGCPCSGAPVFFNAGSDLRRQNFSPR